MKQTGKYGAEMARSSLVALFFVALTFGVFVCTRYLESDALADRNSPQKSILTNEKALHYLSESTQKFQTTPNSTKESTQNSHTSPNTIEYLPESTQNFQTSSNTKNTPINCSHFQSCPADDDYPVEEHHVRSSPACPEYFRWIHEDLWPWRETGVTREMVERAQPAACFRLVISDGKLYIRKHRNSYQTRDIFTQWGILQLLRRYPGKLPDLDLMFDCDDMPLIRKQAAPPPLFRYSSNASMADIVFPDWSFWGWPEIRAKPWEALMRELEEGNRRSEWRERQPYAYWKGTPEVSGIRDDLVRCNVSDKHDWNARIYVHNWWKEMRHNFKNSNLADQCIHRYKIYIEGRSWSVSAKYILACDSTTLFVMPVYHDFFMRSLIPLKHYWPIKSYDKCRSIKHAVDWGNTHPDEAQAIGKAGRDFILNDLRMEHVYDYMFHLLNEYAKLLKYKPTVPGDAVQVCLESLFCPQKEMGKKFMNDSIVRGAALSNPCTMPPPYDPANLQSLIQTKENGIEQVDTWEREYWRNRSKEM